MGLAFTLRKLLSPTLFPLSISLEFLAIGLVLLWFTSRQKTGKWFVTAGVCVLMIISYTPTARSLLTPLEQRYPVAALEPAGATSVEPGSSPRWVVVLGGGYTPDRRLPVTAQISPPSLARLVEGIRLYRNHPGIRLIVSGGRDADTPPEAGPIARVAEILGVNPKALLLEEESLDTEDQARRVALMVGSDRFFLVTSALHMPRAVALFRKRGLDPVPAPADFELKGDGGLTLQQLYPHAQNVLRAEKAVYEYLGLTWARLRGAI